MKQSRSLAKGAARGHMLTTRHSTSRVPAFIYACPALTLRSRTRTIFQTYSTSVSRNNTNRPGATKVKGEHKSQGGGARVKTFCDQNNIDAALKLYRQAPDPFGANALIISFAKKRGDFNSALSVYNALLTAHMRPNIFVINAMVTASRHCKQPGRVLSLVLKHIEKFDIRVDGIGMHMLAAACAEANDAASAQKFLGMILKGKQQHLGKEVNVVDCSQLCKALLSSGDLDGAMEVLDAMVERWGVEPNAQFCAVLLAGCSEAAALPQGQRVHALIEKNRIPINDFLAAALITLYSKGGDLNSAMDVFTQITTSTPGISVWNAIIGAHVKLGLAKEAISLFDDMLAAGVAPDHITISAVLNACVEIGDLARGKQIHAQLIPNDIHSNEFLGTALINLYSKSGGGLDQAVAVFDDLRRASIDIGISVWGAIIKAHTKESQSEKALSLFDDMLAAGVKPDQMLLSTVLSACGDIGDFARAQQLHSLINENRVPINSFLATGLIAAYSKCGALDHAMGVFNDMYSSGSPELGISVWNAIIGAHTKYPGGSETALSLFDNMLTSGVPPNRVTFLAVLPACGNISARTCGKELHALLDRIGIRLDDFLAAALIDMYGRTGGLDDAITLFHNIRQHDLNNTPNNPHNNVCGISSWTAMIGVYGDHRHTKEALALFEEMVSPSVGLKPDAVTLCAVLNACSHGGIVDTAFDIVDTMESRFGIQPGVLHHSCIIDALGRAGLLAEAEAYLLGNQSEINHFAWTALLGACRIHGDVQRAERVEKELRRLAPTNAEPRVLMSNIYAGAGLWADKDRVRQQMMEEGLKKRIPGMSYIEVDGKVNEFMVADKRHPQSDRIHAYLAELWAKMKEAGFVPKTSAVLHNNMTEEEKECHLCHHSEKLALAFGLLNTPEGTLLIISKNLRVCPDCHEATKFIAKLTGRRISVRDASSWHHYDPTTGTCSCKDYW